jgi:hypothetical protein
MESAGRWDPQRGGLIFEWLDGRCPVSPFPPYSPACRLQSRLVSRVNPDPAYDAGMQNYETLSPLGVGRERYVSFDLPGAQMAVRNITAPCRGIFRFGWK